LAGPPIMRKTTMGWLIFLCVFLTVVVAPLVLLLLLQIQFLPYHLSAITWVHRLAFLLDVLALWMLWPTILARTDVISFPPLRTAKVALAISTCLIGFSFCIATQPAEWLDRSLPTLKVVPVPVSTRDAEGTWGAQLGWSSL